MKIVKLQGGLGNQMFQYAFALSLAEETKEEVCFDLSGFDTIPGVTPRSFSLDAFNIDIKKTSTSAVQFFAQERRTRHLTKIKRMFGLKVPSYVQEREHSFHPEVLKVNGDAYFDGYWQSEKYFLPIAKEIREAFTPSKPLSAEGMAMAKNIGDESISLHIRRGDYVTNKKAADALGICDPIYYERALTQAISGLKNPHVFVFSDDIAWVKENLPIPCPATYVSGQNLQNWEELMLMSRCARHILSNSSFSWWGAWLNAKNDTMTIAPARWFKDPALENKDIAPPSWIRI